MVTATVEAISIKKEEFKALTTSVKELSSSHVDLVQSLSGAANGAAGTKKLWKAGNKPWLIKAGIALIVFPDPIVSDVVGTMFLAAGAVQEGIRRQAVYVDDLPKAFQSAMKELKGSKDLV